VNKDKASIFQLFRHMSGAVAGFIQRHRFFFMVLGVIAMSILFLCRAGLQPVAIFLRVHSAEVLGLGLLFIVLRILKHHRKFKWFWIIFVVSALVVAVTFGCKLSPHDYLSLYIRYKTLHRKELAELPVTDYERIQPMSAVKTTANEIMSLVEQASDPHMVRIGDSYQFTFAIEPAYWVLKVFGDVQQVVDVSATSPALNFSAENRKQVSFPVAENFLLGKNTRVSVIRTLGPLRFFSYVPIDSRYIPDDSGEMVQIVPLLRYRGIFFPRPEFGGVCIIRQSPGGFLHFLKSLFVGEGEWIRPEDVGKYEYLRKQNIVPYEVSRYVANSFRFHDGFFAPFPGYHRGDIRIPNLPGDDNEQPFCLFFRFKDDVGESKLYHYFALEPYQKGMQGLNTSLFVPADGVGDVLVYSHYKQKDSYLGVSAVAPKVRSSQKMYDWTNNSIAEQRPYIRDVGGRIRFFWLSTVVTFKNDADYSKGAYIAGSAPQVTLTDALYQQVVWVDSSHPETWEASLSEKLESYWKH